MYFEIYQEGALGLLNQAIGANDWRWRLRAANHETIASGEGYRNRADCLHAIQLVMSTNANTPIRG